MYRFVRVEKCDSHELILVRSGNDVNQGPMLREAVSNFCRVCAGAMAMQPVIEPKRHRVWVRFWDVSAPSVGPRPSSWLAQHLSVRLDGPGTLRPNRSIYVSGGITAWGPCTEELFSKGYQGQSFQAYLLRQFLEHWRDEVEIDGMDLRPVLPNTRVWIGGVPSTQWSYTDKGGIIELDNAELPEPEEHYINSFHLIPPPPDDPDEDDELEELMAMPLEERAEYLSRIAQEARRRKQIERGEQSG